MRPSYEELVSLNTLLAKKTPKEVEELMGAIEDCGYRWEPKRRIFYNAEISMSVRTMGLDLFTPQSFREMYEKHKEESVKYPVQDAHKRLRSYWSPKILGAIFLWLLGGLLLASWKTWLLVLLSLAACSFLFDAYCFNKMRMPKEWLEAERKKYSSPNNGKNENEAQ